VGAVTPLVVPLSDGVLCKEELVGGKAAKLARLAHSGYRVPPGFCLTVAAYETFVRECGIEIAIRMELGRKRLDGMRWEELWDAALRIRSIFLAHPLPAGLREALCTALDGLGATGPLAVRSSALGEDSGGLSFAGLHESRTDVNGETEVEQAVRLVWASLWSDAALLYRRELCLDPALSRMAVLVQEMVQADRSGVAFGRDPRDGSRACAIIEAVPGPCRLLVDGTLDPDRWEIDRQTREVLSWRPGDREESCTDRPRDPLLDRDDLNEILAAVLSLEELLRWSPDVEWTGRSGSLTILQARPITTTRSDSDEERRRYLTLRPGDARLRALRERVANQLIPQLEAEWRRFSRESLDSWEDTRLADAIEERSLALEKWRKIYWDDFIPFAHGVRRLATYYNDFVRPSDPYEFVGLLRNQPLLAAERNRALRRLAARLTENGPLRRSLEVALERTRGGLDPPSLGEALRNAPGGKRFLREFEDLSGRFFDIAYDQNRLQDAPEPLLRNVLELCRGNPRPGAGTAGSPRVEELEKRLLAAVGEGRQEEACEMLAIGRVSWKLRDDDNLLLSGIESQLLRALEVAVQRLRSAGRVAGDSPPGKETAAAVVLALRDPSVGPVVITPRSRDPSAETAAPTAEELPRQLIGQPASPGLASGKLRVVRGGSDLGRFRQGEVLVCDAIQPTMTHLAMLAERSAGSNDVAPRW
jgi:pyruvate,water dikinase